jgi:hypothetical protein
MKKGAGRRVAAEVVAAQSAGPLGLEGANAPLCCVCNRRARSALRSAWTTGCDCEVASLAVPLDLGKASA